MGQLIRESKEHKSYSQTGMDVNSVGPLLIGASAMQTATWFSCLCHENINNGHDHCGGGISQDIKRNESLWNMGSQLKA